MMKFAVCFCGVFHSTGSDRRQSSQVTKSCKQQERLKTTTSPFEAIQATVATASTTERRPREEEDWKRFQSTLQHSAEAEAEEHAQTKKTLDNHQVAVVPRDVHPGISLPGC